MLLYNVLISGNNKENASRYKEWIWAIKKGVDIVHFGSEAETYAYAIENKVDLFILGDSIAGDGSNYNLASKLRGAKSHEMTAIVLISSESDKKQSAYEDLKCYHYFSEPVEEDEFKRILSKPLNYQNKGDKEDYIKLNYRNSTTKVSLDSIVWAEIDNKDIILHGKKSVLMKVSAYHYPLEQLEKILGDGFMRVQQSVVVNEDYIHRVDYTRKLVHVITSKRAINNEVVFRIGSTYVKSVKEQWG